MRLSSAALLPGECGTRLDNLMNVVLTCDVEVWCDGWQDIDAKFPTAFERYMFGETQHGEFGLRHQGRVLEDHGLTGVFFVEPLFSGRFGQERLNDVVEMLLRHRHDVQLHLHTEWLDEWPEPLVDCRTGKRQFLRQFDEGEQCVLLNEGRCRLQRAGAERVVAFRAGSFALNADTLRALSRCGFAADFSYNAAQFGPESGVAPGLLLTDSCQLGDIDEYPMTVYETGFGGLRHAQLGACSSGELELLLWKAKEQGQRDFVLLWHNFELLSPSKSRVDSVVRKRFDRLCRFLSRNRGDFNVCSTVELGPAADLGTQPPPLEGSRLQSAFRSVEQLYRRRYA
jgi:hypothetical protein